MKEINNWLIVIVFSCFLCLNCNKNQTNKENKIKLIGEFNFETIKNENLNSKISFSDSVLLIKSNSFNHSEQKIYNSKVILFCNTKIIKTNNTYEYLFRKYNLENKTIDNLIFPSKIMFANTKNINIIDNKKSIDGSIYKLYYKKNDINNAYLSICYKNKLKSFKFKLNDETPTFFLKDINNDKKDELFFITWKFGYWGYIYNFKIYEIFHL